MFRKFTIFVCLLSFFPAAAGAQDVALLVNSQPVQEERAADQAPAREINLSPPAERQATTLLAANDLQGGQMTEGQRPRKSHEGLTFQEFCEVHFGEYRWVYWVGAVAAIVALHVVVAE